MPVFVSYRDLVQIISPTPSSGSDAALAWQNNMIALADAIATLQSGGSGESSNTPSTLVLRDSSGNFAAGIVTLDGLNVSGDIVLTTTNDSDKPFITLANNGAGGKTFSIGSTNDDSCEGAGLLSVYNVTDGGWPMLLDGSGDVTFSGTVTATAYYGDGSNLTGVSSQWVDIEGGIEYDSGDVFIGGGPAVNNAIRFSPTNQFFGIYDSGSELYLGISKALPAPSGTATVGGYFQGMGIGGATANTSNPIFGVLNSNQSGSGAGNVAFTVCDNNVVQTFYNTLDDGTGVVTLAGQLNMSGNAINLNNGSGTGGGNINMDGGLISFPNLDGTYSQPAYIRTGTFGEYGGISLICYVGYELNWAGGSLTTATGNWTVNIDGSAVFNGNFGVQTTYIPTEAAFEIGNVSGDWGCNLRFTRQDTPSADIRVAAASDGLLFRNFDSTASKMYSFRDYNDTHIWDLMAGGRSLFNGTTDDTSTSVQIGGSESLRTDGTAIFGGEITVSQIGSNYSAIDMFCGLFFHGNNIAMNNEGGAGGGNIITDGGNILFPADSTFAIQDTSSNAFIELLGSNSGSVIQVYYPLGVNGNALYLDGYSSWQGDFFGNATFNGTSMSVNSSSVFGDTAQFHPASRGTNSRLIYLKQHDNDFGYSLNMDDQSTGYLYFKGVNNGVESTIASFYREDLSANFFGDIYGSLTSAATASTGTMSIGGGVSNGETITFDDGNGHVITFTYQDTPTNPNDFNFTLFNDPSTFFSDVFNASGIDITAVYDENVTITFTNQRVGSQGNTSVTNGLTGITMTNMTGGSDAVYAWQINQDGTASFYNGNITIDSSWNLTVGHNITAENDLFVFGVTQFNGPVEHLSHDLRMNDGSGAGGGNIWMDHGFIYLKDQYNYLVDDDTVNGPLLVGWIAVQLGNNNNPNILNVSDVTTTLSSSLQLGGVIVDSSNQETIDTNNRYLVGPDNTVRLDWSTNNWSVTAEGYATFAGAEIAGELTLNNNNINEINQLSGYGDYPIEFTSPVIFGNDVGLARVMAGSLKLTDGSSGLGNLIVGTTNTYPPITITDTGGPWLAGTYKYVGQSGGQPYWGGTSNTGDSVTVSYNSFLTAWVMTDSTATAVWTSSTLTGTYAPNDANAIAALDNPAVVMGVAMDVFGALLLPSVLGQTVDPHVAGQIWNNSGVLNISSG